jgi:hypothetical protein
MRNARMAKNTRCRVFRRSKGVPRVFRFQASQQSIPRVNRSRASFQSPSVATICLPSSRRVAFRLWPLDLKTFLYLFSLCALLGPIDPYSLTRFVHPPFFYPFPTVSTYNFFAESRRLPTVTASGLATTITTPRALFGAAATNGPALDSPFLYHPRGCLPISFRCITSLAQKDGSSAIKSTGFTDAAAWQQKIAQRLRGCCRGCA